MEILAQAGTGLFLLLVGGAAGALVAGGVVALTVGLGITERFIGITHTAKAAKGFETAICLGGLAGSLLTVYTPAVGLGEAVLAAAGVFWGIFVGGWIMALAELLHVFPVFLRRLGETKGKSLIVISLAAGKMLGSLLGFWMRWGKG